MAPKGSVRPNKRKRKASEDAESAAGGEETASVPYSMKWTPPIGPATALIDAHQFAAEAEQAVREANMVMQRIEGSLSMQAVERCSVDELKRANDELYDVEMYKTELRQWHDDREAPLILLHLDGEGGEGDVPVATAEGDAAAGGAGKKKSKKKKKPPVSRGKQLEDPAFDALIKHADDTLDMYKVLPDMHCFLRKTRMSDQNTLHEWRSALSPYEIEDAASPHAANELDHAQQELPDEASPLSSLVYEITFHPVPRQHHKMYDLNRKLQLFALGSTTLASIRRNAHVGGDNIPQGVLETQPAENAWGETVSTWTWSNTRRRTGSCFMIEDRLYPDLSPLATDDAGEPQQQQKSNYARLVIDSFEKAWEAGEADLTTTKPQLTEGLPMDMVRLGDLHLRVGQPYYFLHQGNSEHVFTIDSIRSVHPLDPPAEAFPATTFLSRLVEAKCRICDMDPGTRVALDDDLTGQVPCLLCDVCFYELHGDNSVDQIKTIPVIIEF